MLNDIIYVSNPVSITKIADYFGISFKLFMRSERPFQIYLIRQYYIENQK